MQIGTSKHFRLQVSTLVTAYMEVAQREREVSERERAAAARE